MRQIKRVSSMQVEYTVYIWEWGRSSEGMNDICRTFLCKLGGEMVSNCKTTENAQVQRLGKDEGWAAAGSERMVGCGSGKSR